MARTRFENASIRGIAVCVPTVLRRVSDMLSLFDGDQQKLSRTMKTVGVETLRVVPDGMTAVDLCGEAARQALDRAGWDRNSVDVLIMVTQTPDHPQPCNAAILHGRLGFGSHCASFDVNLGCSGYVYGLWIAYSLIHGAGIDRVLLLAGDTMSRHVNAADRSTAILFGDAGSATLIERSSADPSWFNLHTDGSGYRHLIVPGGGARAGSSESCHLQMDGAEVFNFSIGAEPQSLRELLKFSRRDIGELDGVVLHQANRYIINNIAARIGAPVSKVPSSTLGKYGNQSSASIPSTLCDVFGGQLAANGAGLHLLLSGFGVGLSWASCLLKLRSLSSAVVIDSAGNEL